MNSTTDKDLDPDRTPPRGLPRSFRPNIPCPETMLVIVMTDNSSVLAGYPQGPPAALVTAPEASTLHQVLTEASGLPHPTDEGANGNGTGTNTSSNRSRSKSKSNGTFLAPSEPEPISTSTSTSTSSRTVSATPGNEPKHRT